MSELVAEKASGGAAHELRGIYSANRERGHYSFVEGCEKNENTRLLMPILIFVVFVGGGGCVSIETVMATQRKLTMKRTDV